MAENKTKAAPVSASNDRQTLIHIHSVEDGKTPAPEKLHFGELAVNYKTNNEFISFKNQEGKIVKVLPESKVVKKDGAETITGKKTFSNGLAITNCDQNPNLGFVLGIDAFSDGGTVKWSNTKDLSVGSASSLTEGSTKWKVNYQGANVNDGKYLAVMHKSSDGTGELRTAEMAKIHVGSSDSADYVREANIGWGGKNFAGTYGCIDAAMVNELGANRLAFLNEKGIIIEKSHDGGVSWTPITASSTKKSLFSTGINAISVKKDGEKTATAQDKIRVTIITDKANIYTVLNKFVIYISTNGSEKCTCTISAAPKSTFSDDSPETGNFTTFANRIPISGWSGWNIINVGGITTYGNQPSHYGKVRFLFESNGNGENSPHNGLYVYRIMGFGGVGWVVPSNMAKHGHIYSYDYDQNAIFPAGISTKSLTVAGHSVYHTGNTKPVYIHADGEYTTDPDTVPNSCIYYAEKNGAQHTPVTSGTLLSATETDTGLQIYGNSTKDRFYVRNKWTTWGNWKELLHSGNSSVSKSGETLTVKINGEAKSLTNTDTKVTSVDNHYKPTSGTSTGTGSVTTGNGATVVTSISKDAAGHITEVGLGKLSIPQIPGISVSDSGSGNAVTDVTASGHTVTLTRGTFAEKAFKTVNGDSGTATAETSSDTLTITGGAKIGTVATDTSGADKITINHDTIALSKPSATSGGVLSHGGTFTVVSDITGDGYGHVTSMDRKTFTLPAQYIHPSTSRTDTESSATAIHEGTVTMIDSIESDTEGHITKVNTKTITMPSVPDVAVSTTGSGFVTGVVSDGHGIKVKERAITAEDITSGVFNIERIPKAALERCTVVADDTERFKLTKDTVQNGDTVKVTETKKMYFVKDDEKLSSEAGYEEYLTSTDWSVVTNKPSYFKYVASDNGTATADTTDDTISLVGDGTWVETSGITEPDKITISHKTVTRSNSTTSASPKHGGTVTVVDSVSSDTRGHVTGVNTKTITLPTAYTHPSKPTEGLSDAGSTGTTAGQKTFVMNVNIDSKGHVGSVDKGTIPNEIKVGTAAPSSSIVETIYVDEDDNSTDVELATKAEIQALTTRVTELEAQVKELISTLNTALASI